MGEEEQRKGRGRNEWGKENERKGETWKGRIREGRGSKEREGTSGEGEIKGRET